MWLLESGRDGGTHSRSRRFLTQGDHKAAADRANDAVRAATSPPAHAVAALAVGRAALARGDARAAAAALRDALNDTALPADLRPGAQRDRAAAEATAAVAVTAPPGAPVPWYAPPPAETADPADDEAIQRAQAALWSKKDARKAAGILRRAVSGAERAPAALLAFLYGVEALALRADAAEASHVLARARRAAGRDPTLGDCACCGAAMSVDAPAADRPFVLGCGHCFHAPCLAGFCAKQQGECPSCGKPADAEDVACLWLWAFGDRAARGEPLSDAQRALANELCDAGLAKRIQPPSSSS